MHIQFIPLVPNPRLKFHQKVQTVVKYLINYSAYRYDIFTFILTQDSLSYHDKSIHDNIQMKRLKRNHPADVTFLSLLDELDTLYKDKNNLDHYRGAVLEVFIYETNLTKYGAQNTYRETYLEINAERSAKTIDVGGVKNKNGECFECKVNSDLERDQIANLNWIVVKSNKSLISFLVSAAEKPSLDLALSRLEHDVDIRDINTLGRVELCAM